MKKEIYCFWKHMCGENKCCAICSNKKCEWRCFDDNKKCKFLETESVVSKNEEFLAFDLSKEEVKVKHHNIKADRSVVEKLKKYKKSNKLKTKELSDKIGVNEATLNKLMRDPISKIRSDSYDKIKEFVKKCNTADKKKLW